MPIRNYRLSVNVESQKQFYLKYKIKFGKLSEKLRNTNYKNKSYYVKSLQKPI